VLDNFALLSGHISTLNRLLSSDKMPAFKNYAVIPLALSPGRDTELEVRRCRMFFNAKYVSSPFLVIIAQFSTGNK